MNTSCDLVPCENMSQIDIKPMSIVIHLLFSIIRVSNKNLEIFLIMMSNSWMCLWLFIFYICIYGSSCCVHFFRFGVNSLKKY